MLSDGPQERVDRPVAHLDDVVGDQPVCFAVDGLERRPVGSLGQAEHLAGRVVEPVGDVADAVMVLHPDVERVGGGDLDGGRPRSVMPVEEERHHRKDSGALAPDA